MCVCVWLMNLSPMPHIYFLVQVKQSYTAPSVLSVEVLKSQWKSLRINKRPSLHRHLWNRLRNTSQCAQSCIESASLKEGHKMGPCRDHEELGPGHITHNFSHITWDISDSLCFLYAIESHASTKVLKQKIETIAIKIITARWDLLYIWYKLGILISNFFFIF